MYFPSKARGVKIYINIYNNNNKGVDNFAKP